MTPEEIKDLQQRLEKAEKTNEELQGKYAVVEQDLENAIATKKVPAPKVKGSVKLKLVTNDGESSKTVTAADGAVRIRTADGELIGTEAVFRIANGKEATTEELATYPNLKDFDKEAAIALLTRYATMRVAFLNVK